MRSYPVQCHVILFPTHLVLSMTVPDSPIEALLTASVRERADFMLRFIQQGASLANARLAVDLIFRRN